MPPAPRVATSFQPLYCVRSVTLAGFEALARPVSAAGETVAPAAFFSLRAEAEVARVDRECRRAHLSRFASLDEGRGRLHLNVHPLALAADATLDLRAELEAHGLAPARVCIEIIGAASGDEGLLAQAVAACRAAGVQVAIDDFCIGRSNLDRVARLAPDIVKVDRPALEQAMGAAQARRLLPLVVRMLHEAAAQVVVEGIEEAPDALCAIEAGADLVQGWYFGGARSSLAPDPMAAEIIGRLKRLHAAAVPAADPAG